VLVADITVFVLVSIVTDAVGISISSAAAAAAVDAAAVHRSSVVPAGKRRPLPVVL
jgi:hypothetical protein